MSKVNLDFNDIVFLEFWDIFGKLLRKMPVKTLFE